MSLHNRDEKRVAFYTLGCKVNQQETEAMGALFAQRGYRQVPFTEEADVYIVNTCTVTQVSDKKSRQAISRAHGRNTDACIAVVGCYAQQKPEDVLMLPGVKVVIGTQHRGRIVDIVESAKGDSVANAVEDIQKARAFEEIHQDAGWETDIHPTSGRTRVQVKIQDGCDRYCTYCIIPHVRGPVRSRPRLEIQKEFRRLGETGIGEVVLTGIHLMSYGKEREGLPPLVEIIRVGAEMPGIGRVRLGSLEPALVDDAFVEGLKGIAYGKLCPQFHLSLQSGSDTVLRHMGRRYTAEEYFEAVERLRNAFPGCAITTDVIAGFPGETEEEHQETIAFIKRVRFAHMHVFAYSRREGTKAFDLPGQLIAVEKERRAKEICLLGQELEAAYVCEQVGTLQEVLPEKAFEENGIPLCEGYAGNYVRVRYKGELGGGLVRVRVQSIRGSIAYGEEEL